MTLSPTQRIAPCSPADPETRMSVHYACSPALDVEDLGPARVDWTETHRLASKEIGQDFLIEVSHPLGPIAPGEKVPVIYVLDGNSTFAMTAQIARMLQFGPFPLPRTFVVGIGYHYGEPDVGHRPGVLRMRDLTPWNDSIAEARFRAAPPPWTMPDDIAFGGAPAFRDFIETSVKPFVASRYPVDQADQTLVGMSAGGLFALWSLFTEPDAYRRYVALSPALYWNDRAMFDLAADLTTRVTDLPVQLFLGVGGEEEGHEAALRIVSNVTELAASLRGREYPGLDMSVHVFPDENHMSVYPGALSRGLNAVFGGPGDTRDWARALKS